VGDRQPHGRRCTPEATGRLTNVGADRLVATAIAIRRPAVDVLVVLLALTFAFGNDHFDRPDEAPLVWAFDLALVLPLLWRRRQPAIVFLVIAAVALVQWWIGLEAGGDVAVLVALYTVGAYEPRRLGVVTSLVVAQIGVVMAAVRWAPPDNGLSNAILLAGTVTAAWVLGSYVRSRRALLSSVLERAATAERERDQQAVIATATERARISREMHDIVAHSLSVMIALSDGAAITATRTPEAARTAMLQSSALGRQALGEMRRLLSSLNGAGPGDHDDAAKLTPQPGIADLDDLIDRVRSAGPAVDLVILGHPPDLAPGAQLTIYRMVQEALTNVLKHAPAATRAVVTLRYGASVVGIEVENDDRPRAPDGVRPAETPAAGHGLTGMRERAAVFGGTIEAGRRSDGGWRVTTHLELEEQNTR
jgi:signal transduction histidine kinase